MRNRYALEFIGIWEKIHNPEFKGIEFETFRNQAGLNSFSLTPRKWIRKLDRPGRTRALSLVVLIGCAVTWQCCELSSRTRA